LPQSLQLGSLWSVGAIPFSRLFLFITTSCILLWVSDAGPTPYSSSFPSPISGTSGRSRATLYWTRSDWRGWLPGNFLTLGAFCFVLLRRDVSWGNKMWGRL
jgi:hypothetical protein